MPESSGPRIVLVAGLARDRTIGKDGDIPWHYGEDLRNFKATTLGTMLVMGRRTFDAIGKALPGRENVVLTRDPAALAARAPDVTAVASLEEALDLAREQGVETVSVIGGAEVYRLALLVADEMLLTFVPEDGGGDTFFPDWDHAAWRETSRETLDRVEVVRYERSS